MDLTNTLVFRYIYEKNYIYLDLLIDIYLYVLKYFKI
jgi:hypothetical protein